MGDANTYPNLPDISPNGQPLDWAWLRGARSEWGVQPKPSPRGLTMMDIAVGSLRRGAGPPHPSLDGSPGRRRRSGHARHGLHPQHEVGRLGRERHRALRGGRRPPVVAPPATSRGASCEELADDLEHAMCQVCTIAHRGRDDRRRPAGEVDVADEPRLRRGEDVPLHADHGRGPPRRGVPQASARQRRWPPHVALRRRPACCARSSRPRPTRRPPRCMHLLGEGFILDLFRRASCIAPGAGREADVPHGDAGRGPPRRLRHDAHPVRRRARPRRGRGDPRGPRPRRGGAHRVRHHTRPRHGASPCCSPAGSTTWRTRASRCRRELSKKQFTSYLSRCERAGLSRLERTKLPLDLLGIDPRRPRRIGELRRWTAWTTTSTSTTFASSSPWRRR